MPIPSASSRVCAAIARNPDIPSAAAHILAWIVGTAMSRDGFPLWTYRKDIISGTGCHSRTVNACLDYLQDSGMLIVRSEEAKTPGHPCMVITLGDSI